MKSHLGECESSRVCGRLAIVFCSDKVWGSPQQEGLPLNGLLLAASWFGVMGRGRWRGRHRGRGGRERERGRGREGWEERVPDRECTKRVRERRGKRTCGHTPARKKLTKIGALGLQSACDNHSAAEPEPRRDPRLRQLGLPGVCRNGRPDLLVRNAGREQHSLLGAPKEDCAGGPKQDPCGRECH
jgi:hypothetical protein